MKNALDNIAAAVGIIGGAAAIFVGLVRTIRWAHRVLRQLDRVILIWWGDPTAEPDDEARHGLVSRLRTMWRKIETMEQRLERVETQLKPNGGKSLADAVSRIARTQGVPGVGEDE